MMRKRVISDREWNRVKANHSPGTRVNAVVKQHVGFGALCEVGTTKIPAILRKLEFDWDPVKQVAATLPEGTLFEASVLDFEDSWRELIISRKAAEAGPFKKFAESHHPGEIVDGVIHQLAPMIMVIRLSAGIQGEIPWPRVPEIPTPRTIGEDLLTDRWQFALGDCIKAAIVSFDVDQRTVRLDMNEAVRRADEEHKLALEQWRAGGSQPQISPISTETPLLMPLASELPSTRLCVLLVDDSEHVVFPLAASLSDRGHHVETANLAADATRLIDNLERIDVAIVDQQLLDGVGLSLLRRVQDRFPDARLILFTAKEEAIHDIHDDDRILFLRKPADTAEVVALTDGTEHRRSEVRREFNSESVGDLSQMTGKNVEHLSADVRSVLDNYVTSLLEAFPSSKIAILRMQKSNNGVECLRAHGVNSSVFQPYSDRLRFSFVGNVLAGTASGFFRPVSRLEHERERDPLEDLLPELKLSTVYGTRLQIESQANPMGVFAFFPERSVVVECEEVRAFEQTARALALAIERATIDANLFRNQRIMMAGSMLLGMAHELRNEVQAVGSMADYLVTLVDAGERQQPIRHDRIVEGINHVRLNTSRLRKLIESALSLTGKANETKRTLGVLLEDAMFKCQMMAAKDDVCLMFEVESIDLLQQEVTSSMQQVFMNLILNAIQHVRLFRENLAGFVRIVVKRECINDIPQIAVRVIDNAFGINWESRTQIFDPYYTTRLAGTGLGLSISRLITQSNHGRLDLEWSRKFFGSCFLLRLPLKE